MEHVTKLLSSQNYYFSEKGEELDLILPTLGVLKEEFILPKSELSAKKNTLSAAFGLNEFPFHSDGATSAIPPKYIYIKFNGDRSSEVKFSIFNTDFLTNSHEFRSIARDALFRVKNGPKSFITSIIKVTSGITFFRYNPFIMAPLNNSAKQIAELIQEHQIHNKIVFSPSANSSIIFDNHRVLHSRGSVSESVVGKRWILRKWIFSKENV